MSRVNIHQIQVKYDPSADRILLQVRTQPPELYQVWLTRRMALRFWPHFQPMVASLALPSVSPGSVVSPEARQMLSQAARDKPLPHADFKTQFQADGAATPLGPEPVLATEISLKPTPTGGVMLQWREAGGRSLTLQVTEELSLALLRLLESALVASQWGVVNTPAAGQQTPGESPPALLN